MTPPFAKPETDADQTTPPTDADVATPVPETAEVTRLQPGQGRRPGGGLGGGQGGGGGLGGGLRRAQMAQDGSEKERHGGPRGGNGPGPGLGRGRGLGDGSGGGPGGGMGGGRAGMQAGMQARGPAGQPESGPLVLRGPVASPNPGVEDAEVVGQTNAAAAARRDALMADGGARSTPQADAGRPNRPNPARGPAQDNARGPAQDNARGPNDAKAFVGDPAPVKVKPQGKPKTDAPVATGYIPSPTVQPAKMRPRHWGLVLVFMLLVIVPTGLYGWYMYAFAADQYESDVGFGSRTEGTTSPFAFLGALGGLAGSTSPGDMDILNQFIVSQELVTRIDKKLDLRALFSKPKNDPLMALAADSSIEDLVKYWQSMVIPSFDTTSQLMSLKVYAFDPKDAQMIAQAVLDESTSIINELSVTAQDDATRYGKASLDKSQADMISSQNALTTFRITNHIVDPTVSMAGDTAVFTSLVQQLATAEIDLDLLTGTVPDSDPRIGQMNRRITVIQNRLVEEQAKVGGLSDPNGAGYAKLVADYASLQLLADFASKTYLTALATYEQAVTAAQQKTQYLATYVSPTLAETSQSPNRPLRILLMALAGFLAWSAVTMIYYALRDRR